MLGLTTIIIRDRNIGSDSLKNPGAERCKGEFVIVQPFQWQERLGR